LFSIEYTHQRDLDKGIPSESVRQTFEENGFSLSADATILVEKSGEKWLVHDAEQKYQIIKKVDTLHIYQLAPGIGGLIDDESKGTPKTRGRDQSAEGDTAEIAEKLSGEDERESDSLFNLEITLQGDLDKGLLSASIRQKFEENGFPLSGNVQVHTEKEGQRWSIEDAENVYDIAKGASKLNVYSFISVPDEGNESPATKVRGQALESSKDQMLEIPLESESIESLTPEQIIQLIREEFPLSTNATVQMEKEGLKWRVYDTEHKYQVTKDTGTLMIYSFASGTSALMDDEFSTAPKTRGRQQDDFLFSMKEEFQNDFDEGILSEDVRQKFEKSGFPLSTNALILTGERGRKWLIIDIQKAYFVVKEANWLKIRGFLLSPIGKQ
jgi:hypothetical protein